MDGEHEGCGHDLSITLHTPSNGEPAYCYLCEVGRLRAVNAELLDDLEALRQAGRELCDEVEMEGVNDAAVTAWRKVDPQ